MDKCREEFNLWFSLNNPAYEGFDYLEIKKLAWKAWQASRAAIKIKLHKLPEALDYGNGGVYRSHVEDMLDEAGITYE